MSCFQRRKLSWADHPGHSRVNLGPSVYGTEYDRRLDDMAMGSDMLLRSLWHNHQRVMLVAKAKGRQVVVP